MYLESESTPKTKFGWKAIEEYLSEVEREAAAPDQTVPQLVLENPDIMPYNYLPTDQHDTDFLADDELTFNKPTPVLVDSPTDSTFTDTGSTDIYNLDESVSQDLSFYTEPFIQNQAQAVQNCSQQQQQQHQQQQSYPCLYDGININFENPAFRPVSEYCDRRAYYNQNSSNSNSHSNCISSSSNNFNSIPVEQNIEDFLRTQTLNDVVVNMAAEVEDTCRRLGISSDPRSWAPKEVQTWILSQCQLINCQQPNMDNFYIPGADLCALNEEDFRFFAPESGPMLFTRLVFWRSVVEQTTQAFPPQVSQIPVPRSPTVSPLPDSISLSPSSQFRDDESQPSSPPYCQTDDADRLPNESVHPHRQTIQLWQFLKLLLLDGHYTDCIRWVDRSRGIFKIENSTRVAKLWGKRKNRPAMNYDKLSRSIRQYYKKNIIKKTEHSKRLVYQFCQM